MQDPRETDSYMALIDAIQNHVRVISQDNNAYARDWVLVCGIEDIHGNNQHAGTIRLERSPRSAAYTVTGLLNWALDCYSVED